MTADISLSPMSFLQAEIANIPATAVSLSAGISLSRSGGKHGVSFGKTFSLSSAPSSTNLTMPYIPAFGDAVGYSLNVSLDQDRDGRADASQNLDIRSTEGVPSDQTFDLSDALSAPSVTVTGADTARPILSWSGVDPASAYIYLSANVRSPAESWYLSFGDLIRSRTSITYPELPDSLASFRPNMVDYFFVGTYSFEGSVSKSSYGSYYAP